MKKIFLALLLVAAFGTAKAQDYLLDNPDNNSYFGVRVGADVMSLKSPSPTAYGNNGGFFVGAIYNIPIFKNLYFEPGIYFFYNSAKIKAIWEFDPGTNLPTLERSSGKINDWGLRVPFNFGYHFDLTDRITVFPYTGPQLNVNLANSVSFATNVVPGNNTLHCNVFDLGWNFGVGVTYSRFLLTVGGTVGMTHYVKNPALFSGLYARRNLFTIALGYNF